MYDNVKLLTDSEGHQIVPIPDEYRFDTLDVFVNSIGESITVTPLGMAEAEFKIGAAMLGPDFLAEEYPEELFSAPDSGEGREHGV